MKIRELNDSKELFAAFEKLSLDDKRNTYNSEFISLCKLVKMYLAQFGNDVDSENFTYTLGKDMKMTESDLLNYYFKDLMEFRENLLMLLMYYSKKDE